MNLSNFSCVFERVVQEDGVKSGELHVLPANPAQIQQHQAPQAPPTLRPAAADGYLLLRVSQLQNLEKFSLVYIPSLCFGLGFDVVDSQREPNVARWLQKNHSYFGIGVA